jgi:hypothetical protein
MHITFKFPAFWLDRFLSHVIIWAPCPVLSKIEHDGNTSILDTQVKHTLDPIESFILHKLFDSYEYIMYEIFL